MHEETESKRLLFACHRLLCSNGAGAIAGEAKG
jgi:hypothetical protein